MYRKRSVVFKYITKIFFVRAYIIYDVLSRRTRLREWRLGPFNPRRNKPTPEQQISGYSP